MSLLKARNLYNTLPISATPDLQREFLEVVDECLEGDTPVPTTSQIVLMVRLYIEASVNYLLLASTLVDDEDLQATMKFMNSYIAEFMHIAGLHYFHQEGMTIIDLALQKALDEKGFLTDEHVEDIIARIEGSYAEEVEEEH